MTEAWAPKVVDGTDIQSLNIRWLRSQMGLVRQQPVLFDTTIFENITYGAVDSSRQPSGEALEQQVIAVAKMANAHDFISALPDGYQTRVGENATQLSGGQKQRIAIARALMRDPKILLLDEATSALDTGSEAAVQLALSKAAHNRTTIVIAHRLSTIRHADNIVVMSEGRVVEQGTHADLIARDGHYARLVHAQQVGGEFGEQDSDMVDETVENSVTGPIKEDGFLPALKKECERDPHVLEIALDQEIKPKGWGLGKTMILIVRWNKAERWMLLLGLICSIFAGLALPG
jgi:ATP-binding cassette, subfamily B (MDR/TAP), member 1